MTAFDHRTREEDGPAGSVFPGPTVISGGSPVAPSAPIGASYVTTEPEAGLANERVIAAGEKISFIDQGPGGTLTIAADAIAGPDVLDLPGQNTALAATIIATAAVAGVYTIVASATVSVAAAVGTMSAEAQYTNAGAHNAEAFALFDLTVAGTTAGMASFQHTGGDITVTTTMTGLVGVPTYEVHFRLIRLG